MSETKKNCMSETKPVTRALSVSKCVQLESGSPNLVPGSFCAKSVVSKSRDSGLQVATRI